MPEYLCVVMVKENLLRVIHLNIYKNKTMKKYILPIVIALSALSVSASAAFYSVTGLSMLFAGASVAVLIMASSLEVAKLVIASLLYQYRKTLPKGLKIYLTTAAVVLVLITSMGIYGFLSSAYQETASKAGTLDSKIALVETKRDNIKTQLSVFNAEKESINKSVTDLRNGLSNNVITYTNAQGQVMTSTSSATRKTLEKQLDQAIERQTEINSRVDELNTKLFDYETEIVEVSTNSELAGELGPLKYLSGLTGIPMDRIINYLLLVIIFVFDPLAIALVIAANFAFAQIHPKTKENIYGEIVKDEDDLDDDFDEDNIPIPNESLVQAVENYEHIFDQADTNNDGFIDIDEAKDANLDTETTDKLNRAHQALESIENLNNTNNYDFQWKKDIMNDELKIIKQALLDSLNKQPDKDDNTITYF